MNSKDSNVQQDRTALGQATAGSSNYHGSTPTTGQPDNRGTRTDENRNEQGTATWRPYTGALLKNNGDFGSMFYSDGNRSGSSNEQVGGESDHSKDSKHSEGNKGGPKKEGSGSGDKSQSETVGGKEAGK
ncbi:MAG: hypothetical protein Q9161_007922 [Pseudevernia consocians]